MLVELLVRLNIVVASATVLIAFSLATYLFVYNFRNPVARTFVAVLAFVTVAYVGDVFLSTARLPAAHPAAAFWLRFKWLGISFVVPAYLHFSDRLLWSVGDRSSARRWAVLVGYTLGALVLGAVLATELVVTEVVGPPGAVRFQAGPLFPAFALAYAAGTVVGTHNVWRARSLTLTARSRWRMTMLLVSAIAPLSIFPYLVASGGALAQSIIAFWLVAGAANTATATMLVVVAYAVAYHGALVPDRAVKRDLIKYLIQVPTLGFFIIAATQLVPRRLENQLGLPRDVVIALGVGVGVVAFQFVVRALKPLVDALIYGAEGRDVQWLRRLDERLLSERDLAQLLENILTALCDRLRLGSGFVVVMSAGRLQVDVSIGPREDAVAMLDALDQDTLTALAGGEERFTVVDGYWLHALRPPGGGATLGLLAIERPDRELTAEERETLQTLLDAADGALADRVVQQRVVSALRDLEPELEGLQRLRGALERRGPRALAPLDASPVYSADFPNWVKDALSHYWGGPKLTESPLQELNVVRDALEAHDYNTGRALRAVLDEALERLKPEGERSMTASQWMIYNILELKFVRGLRVRDIALRLAMSESDLYRKQRVAIDALADQLAALEEAGPELEVGDGAAGVSADGEAEDGDGRRVEVERAEIGERG